MLSFKKHIALLSLFVLLIPSVIQFSHAFEEHQDKVCCASTDSHICELENDCDDLHLQLTYFSHDFILVSDDVSINYNTETINYKRQLFSSLFRSKTSSRAPPALV